VLQWALFRRAWRRTDFVPPSRGQLAFHTLRCLYLTLAIVLVALVLDALTAPLARVLCGLFGMDLRKIGPLELYDPAPGPGPLR
jgi:hypothetical protein